MVECTSFVSGHQLRQADSRSLRAIVVHEPLVPGLAHGTPTERTTHRFCRIKSVSNLSQLERDWPATISEQPRVDASLLLENKKNSTWLELSDVPRICLVSRFRFGLADLPHGFGWGPGHSTAVTEAQPASWESSQAAVRAKIDDRQVLYALLLCFVLAGSMRKSSRVMVPARFPLEHETSLTNTTLEFNSKLRYKPCQGRLKASCFVLS